ncbi:hypothetical protein HAX54_046019 [Datura stramonium]|uniref:Uncharacterized protein n=1 Tax=Datura stramonium TaxID=4076 RepID=A0ABS8SR75_DATST|nr:hypothetical protein [Datura stramonium]
MERRACIPSQKALLMIKAKSLHTGGGEDKYLVQFQLAKTSTKVVGTQVSTRANSNETVDLKFKVKKIQVKTQLGCMYAIEDKEALTLTSSKARINETVIKTQKSDKAKD